MVVGDLDLLEVVEQGRPVVPAQAVGPVDDVVAVERGDRDVCDVGDVELLPEAGELVDELGEPVGRVVDEVHLVDGDDEVGDPRRAEMNAWRLDCSTVPLRASSRTIARSAVDAPVTMLRVYCWWPGQSAMMNRRRGVAKYR